MQGSLRAIAAILTFLCLGCATSVDVSIEQQRDLSRYRTWDFLSQRARNVNAPVSSARGLELAVTRFVERCMQSRGFERATGQPDFHVLYFLEVRREQVIVEETPAASSLHSMKGLVYDVQTQTQSRVEIYETGRLRIFVTDDDGVIWQGDFAARFRGELSPHLGGAVSDLLELLPAASASDELAPHASDELAPHASDELAPHASDELAPHAVEAESANLAGECASGS